MNKLSGYDFLISGSILFFVVVMIAQAVSYIDVASNCNGVVVKDYIGMPACVDNPSPAILSR